MTVVVEATMTSTTVSVSPSDSSDMAMIRNSHYGESIETMSTTMMHCGMRHTREFNTTKLHANGSIYVAIIFMVTTMVTILSSLDTCADAFILHTVPSKVIVASSIRRQRESTSLNYALKESSAVVSSSSATTTTTSTTETSASKFEDLFSFSLQAPTESIWTNSDHSSSSSSPISLVTALYNSMSDSLVETLTTTTTRMLSSSSSSDSSSSSPETEIVSKNELSSESISSFERKGAPEIPKAESDDTTIGDDDDDDDGKPSNSYKKSRQQSDLARVALLIGKKGQRALRKKSTTSSRGTTSVGERRVGSATQAREGIRASATLMDALRKKAQGAAAGAAAENENSNNNTKENENNNNKNEHTKNDNNTQNDFSSLASKMITPAAVHAAVADLLQRRREYYPQLPHQLMPQLNFSDLPSSFTTASCALLDTAVDAVAAPSAEQVAAILDSFRKSTIGILENAEITILPSWQSSSLSISSSKRDVCVRVATHLDDVNVANLRLSVFSDFCSQQQSQFCARSCMAIANRRMRGAVCVVATDNVNVDDNDDDNSHTNTVVLGSAEVSHHEFVGTRLAQHRLDQSILYVTEVAVNPAARRRGIGYKLLQALDDIAKQRGDGVVETMYLHVDVSNQAALALYEKCGYRRVDQHHTNTNGSSSSSSSSTSIIMEPHVQAMFHEFTTSLNLHPGATKGRDHYLLYKNLVPEPTWLTVPCKSRSSVVKLIKHNSNDMEEETPTMRRRLSGLCHRETQRPKIMGTLGFEVPA